MGWHVSIEGEVHGPVSDEQVQLWVSQGLTDAMLCAEGSKAWMSLRQSPFAPPATATPVVAAQPGGTEVIAQLLLLLPVAVGFVYRFAVAPYTPAPLLWLTVIVSSFLIAIEAAMCGMGSETDSTGKKGSGVLVWWFASLLLWIFVYPLFLQERGKYGRRNLGGWGIASAVAMLLLLFL